MSRGTPADPVSRRRRALSAAAVVLVLAITGVLIFFRPRRDSAGPESGTAVARGTGIQILLVGLDGADWQIAEPLMAAGRMPNLSRLRERGASGNLKALVPILSPLLWTSMATGTTAERHGITDFLIPDPATGKRIPVTSRSRKVPALWNYFTELGRTVDFVAWWATWPAEKVAGHMISDRLSYSLFTVDPPPDSGGLTYPPDFLDEARTRSVSDRAITYEDVRRFADLTPEEFAASRSRVAAGSEAAYRDPVNHLTKILAATRSYHLIALDLIRAGQADLTAIYYQGIDEVSHRFIHFSPPRLAGMDAADVRRFGGVVERFYEYQDQLLGELIEAADPRTLVVVVSDHGFVNGPDRPAGLTADIEGQPGRWHRPYGMVVLSGGPILQTKLDTISPLDVGPTVMFLAGLPVPEQMVGRVLTEAVAPAFAAAHPAERMMDLELRPSIEVTRQPAVTMPDADEEMLEKLRSLGYIAAGDAPDAGRKGGRPGFFRQNDPAAAPPATVTSHVNLAGVYLASDNLEKAEEEVLAALRLAPRFAPALHELFNLRMRQRRFAEAISSADGLLARVDARSDLFLSKVARAYREAGRSGEGIARFEGEVSRGRWLMGVPLSRLLFDEGRTQEARRAARRVLDHDPLSEGAMAILFQVERSAGNMTSLEQPLREALTRNPRSVIHLNWLSVLLQEKREFEEAESLLLRSLAVDPDHVETAANLGALYIRRGSPAGAEPLLRRALRLSPANVEAKTNLGTCLAMQKRYDEAIAQFEALVAMGRHETDLYNALGKAYGLKGDSQSAAYWLQRSLDQTPDQPEVRELRDRAGRQPQ